MRSTYPFTLVKADSGKLSEEFSVALGQPVRVNYITPGQPNHEPVLWVTDEEGEEVEVAPAEVERLLAAHVPPPAPVPVTQKRAEARTKAAAAASVVALRTALLEFMDTF